MGINCDIIILDYTAGGWRLTLIAVISLIAILDNMATEL